MSNRLAHEKSPYLRRYRKNPVDWYPWCGEAFERAKREHKAIFISIGHSSCHWCHLMAREVFGNEQIAAYLNEHMICIKVDRDERPDIGKHFQRVHGLLNRSTGGWPASIFCTPDNKPFYAATYLPPETIDRKMGFTELVHLIAEKIARHDTALFKNADEIQSFLTPSKRPTEASRLTEQVALTYLRQAQGNYDPRYGGFASRPKFPHTSTLTALLNITLLEQSDDARAIVEHTLNMMRQGGLHDLVDGGFFRYAADEQWRSPHFGKTAYDNALLCELYAAAGEKLGNPAFIGTARETADFMLKQMSEDGLFYAAVDDEAGRYFGCSQEEVAKALADAGFESETIATVLAALPVAGHETAAGQSIIRADTDERPEWLEDVRALLKKIRDARPAPFIDTTVQTAWNAMMVRALFTLGRHDRRYHDAALTTLNALTGAIFIDGTLYHSSLIGKPPRVEAFLEDYAWLGTAMVCAYHHTLDDTWLIQAQQLANMALERFFDAGRWFFSRDEVLTEAEITDSDYPGAVGVSVDLLLSLGSLVDHRYRRLAFKSIEYYSLALGKTPISHPSLFNQAYRYIKGDRIVKAEASRLLEHHHALFQIRHPFIQLHADPSADAFLVCTTERCIARTHDVSGIAPLISGSF